MPNELLLRTSQNSAAEHGVLHERSPAVVKGGMESSWSCSLKKGNNLGARPNVEGLIGSGHSRGSRWKGGAWGAQTGCRETSQRPKTRRTGQIHGTVEAPARDLRGSPGRQ